MLSGKNEKFFGASPYDDPNITVSQNIIAFDTFQSLVGLYGFASLDGT